MILIKKFRGHTQQGIKKVSIDVFLLLIFTVNFLINFYNLYQHMQADIQDAILKKLATSEVLDSAQLQA